MASDCEVLKVEDSSESVSPETEEVVEGVKRAFGQMYRWLENMGLDEDRKHSFPAIRVGEILLYSSEEPGEDKGEDYILPVDLGSVKNYMDMEKLFIDGGEIVRPGVEVKLEGINLEEIDLHDLKGIHRLSSESQEDASPRIVSPFARHISSLNGKDIYGFLRGPEEPISEHPRYAGSVYQNGDGAFFNVTGEGRREVVEGVERLYESLKYSEG